MGLPLPVSRSGQTELRACKGWWHIGQFISTAHAGEVQSTAAPQVFQAGGQVAQGLGRFP